MAFSQVENSYMDMIAEAYNPTMPPEPEPQDEPSLEGLQLAAGPSATRTDAPQGYGEARAVQPTKLESALKTAGVTLEQIGRFVDGIGQVDVPGLGPISLADLIPFVGSAKGDRSVMGTDWQGTPMMLQQLGRGESVKGQPRISSVVGPDGLTYYGTSGSPPMLNVDASLAAFDALPLAQGVRTGARLAVKGAKKAVTELGPTAGKMAEDYMRATGGVMDVAPPSLRVDSIDRFPIGPGSIKPKVVAADKPLYREMNVDGLSDFLREDNQFSYKAVFVADNADLALGQGINKGVKVTFRSNAVSGEENLKPMTGDLAGREYKADVFAPKAIESITFNSEADLKKIKGLSAKVLQTEFKRTTEGKKNIVFVRKGQLPAADIGNDSLTKTGAILNVAPDSPSVEVPSAPKLSTPAFKNWFGDSKIVDEKGQPLVMYHGTKIQFEQFDPNIGYQGAMFFSPKREFAENYMAGTDVKEPIAVYISAKNPFDYENPVHRQKVIDLAIENTAIYKNSPDQEGMRRVLDEALTAENANWTTIEDKAFQDSIKKLGFDSFYVKESGVKNLAVYNPTQIKSVFNKGTFDPKDPRIMYGGGAAGAASMQDKEKK
jgi:hypothetical protein